MVHVIDDDPAIRDALAILLESAFFQVRTYESATLFLDQGLGGLEGCVVTDVEMPQIDGIELLKRLAAAKSALPAIVMSGRSAEVFRAAALGAGAVAFLEKPFDDEAVLSAVHDALAPGQAAPSA